MRYAEVLLPLPLANTFTYRIPEAMLPATGLYCRVVAPFGKKHYYTGIVVEIHDRQAEQQYEVKDLFMLLDEKPVINHSQFSFWRWISSYYLCTLGEVCRAALPAGLKIESETIVTINSGFESGQPLKPNEQTLLDALTVSTRLSVEELEKKTGLKNIFPVINSLLLTGAIEISETLKKGFKPKTETYLNLAGHIRTEADLCDILEGVKRAKQQEKLLLDFLELSGIFSASTNPISAKAVLKKHLLDYTSVNAQVLNGLLQRGILIAEEKMVSRIDLADTAVREMIVLSLAQQKAYDGIKKSFETNAITLLHSDASGGKTGIYIRKIQETLSGGWQALYLLPEIALTTQITERLRKVFGSQLFIYNSGISDNERVEIWNRLMHYDEPFIVLGVRSSIFLPFSRLGLIIIDEEQESSYKQQDPAPRYHARNAAMMLAHQHKAKTLLGSATPSLESWLWAKKGKYGYVKLDNGWEDRLSPTIEVVNVSELRRKKKMKDILFSPILKEKIDEALSEGEQVILFQNRRGFAPFIACRQCEEIPHCRNCDVSLTYHKLMHRLVCHYCGYSIPFPLRCPSCSHGEMKIQGFGTEKIEEEVAVLFPLAKTARLDLDTARTESAYKRILTDFEDGKTQILIGTQLVAKGFNFTNVSVVGVLNADGMMNIPDFRAYERTFQLIYQVAVHAIRSDRRGFVIIQTSQAINPLLKMLQQLDYPCMAQTQLQERHQFRYPPYTRLILLVLRSRNEQVLDEIAEQYTRKLRSRLGHSVSGPVYPPVTRVQTLHVRKIMLKIELSVPVSDARKILEEVRMEMQKNPLYSHLILHYDVDPQ